VSGRSIGFLTSPQRLQVARAGASCHQRNLPDSCSVPSRICAGTALFHRATLISIDPVGGGLVKSLARPGGNLTGFSDFELGTASKWLELLKEITPSTTRVAVLLQHGLPPNSGFLRALEDAGRDHRSTSDS
jgi:hypothetical protein